MIDFWCGKCQRDVVFGEDQDWALTKHLLGQCLDQLLASGRDWIKDPPPDWIKITGAIA